MPPKTEPSKLSFPSQLSQTRQLLRQAIPVQTLHDVMSLYSSKYAVANAERTTKAAGFSGAGIYRIETDCGSFCLRAWPVLSLAAERIKGLHRLLRSVFDRGLHQVAVPVAALDGETLIRHAGRYWQLEPWMPGVANYWSNPSRKKLTDAMARLALLHQLTRDYTDSGNARPWFFHEDAALSPAVQERLAYLNAWKETKIWQLQTALAMDTPGAYRDMGRELAFRFERTAPFIAAKLDVLSRIRFRLQPCLRDLWHDHVLFTGDKLTGLIDASACRSENFTTDLARLLGSLLGDDREAWEFAIAEYERHAPLDAHEKALLEALDQSGVLLSGLAWMDRLLIKREFVSHPGKVFDRIRSLLARLKTLEQSLDRSLFQ